MNSIFTIIKSTTKWYIFAAIINKTDISLDADSFHLSGSYWPLPFRTYKKEKSLAFNVKESIKNHIFTTNTISWLNGFHERKINEQLMHPQRKYFMWKNFLQNSLFLKVFFYYFRNAKEFSKKNIHSKPEYSRYFLFDVTWLKELHFFLPLKVEGKKKITIDRG